MFGNVRNVKSMAHVDNGAAFLAHCVSEAQGVHVYNYVDKPDLSMNKLALVTRRTLFEKPGMGVRLPAYLGVAIDFCFDFMTWVVRRPLSVSSLRVKKFMATTAFNSSAETSGFMAPCTLSERLEKTLRHEFIEDNQDNPTCETE